MQNSFEKQVKDKMDELKFVPTEPVWQNIERQIRNKKDRRRLLLWLPFFALVLGGAGWWLASQHGIGKNVANVAVVSERGLENAQPKQNTIPPAESKTSRQVQNKDVELTTPPGKKDSSSSDQEKVESKATEVSRVNENRIASHPDKLHKQKTTAGLTQGPITLERSSGIKPVVTTLKKNAINQATLSPSTTMGASLPVTPDAIITKRNTVKDSSAKLKLAEEGLDTSNLFTAVVQKQNSHKQKWQWGIVAGGGISGYGKKLGAFSEEKAMQDYTATPNNGVPPPVYGPSPVTKNMAFTAGVALKKNLEKRLVFSTGLQYHYYSTTIKVGPQVSGAGSFSRDATQYYLNTAMNARDYQNHYHFISLPAAVEWQVLKQLPLQLHAGLSVQQLVATDALVFDKADQVYYSDKDAFNKTQLFADLGLSYPVFNKQKTVLHLGPQLQYGITNIEKNTSGKHLYSLGITARFLFQKN